MFQRDGAAHLQAEPGSQVELRDSAADVAARLAAHDSERPRRSASSSAHFTLASTDSQLPAPRGAHGFCGCRISFGAMTTQQARRPPPVPRAHIHVAARPVATVGSKDVEAVGPPSRTASEAAALAPRHRTLFWVALAVLVAACATAAIVLGVGLSQQNGSSSSSSSSSSGDGAAPLPQQPPPAVRQSTPAAGATPVGSTPAGSAAPAATAASPPASGPAGSVTPGTPSFTVPSGFTALW